MSMASERKAEMQVFHSGDVIVSDRIYNLTLGATVLWGVAMNVVLCAFAVILLQALIRLFSLLHILHWHLAVR